MAGSHPLGNVKVREVATTSVVGLVLTVSENKRKPKREWALALVRLCHGLKSSVYAAFS